MGIMSWLLGTQDNDQINEKAYIESLSPINEDLEAAVRSYVDNNFGKPYISVDEIIKKSKDFRRGCQKELTERKNLIDDDKLIVTDEDYNNNRDFRKPESKPEPYSGNVRYSISSDCDRQQLSKDADQFYSAVSRRENVDPYRYKGFHEVFMEYLNRSGMQNSEVYKKGNVSKAVFSKILSDRTHIPKKGTILALAVALKLNLKETETLLMKAGYTFSNTLIGDLVTVYFITHENYDIDALNRALYDLDQPILGSKSY